LEVRVEVRGFLFFFNDTATTEIYTRRDRRFGGALDKPTEA
jgi:hypothetical protein